MDNSVVVVSVGAGYAYGSQGYTHHALEDLAIMRALPNIDVIAPADPLETSSITKFLCSSEKPAYLRLGKSKDVAIHKRPVLFSHGKILEVVSGSAGTILFSGSVGTLALKAHEELSRRGFSVAVASVPFLSSLDSEYLSAAFKKGPVITVEEHGKRGGLGSAILEHASEAGIFTRVGVIASIQENLSLVGDQDFLRAANGITSENITKKFMALVAASH